MQIGIIGLPNAGKSTIFNALTKSHAAVANYPFSTIEPNIGLLNVFDPDLPGLAAIFASQKITFSNIKILDIAGLVKGASRGEGLGNKFLSHIREVDAVAHILRCFYDENVPHGAGELNPLDDIDTVTTELMLADIQTIEKRKEKLAAIAKSGDPQAKNMLEFTSVILDKLDKQDLEGLRSLYIKNPELFFDLDLLSTKPVLYVANVNDDEKSQLLYRHLEKKMEGRPLVKIYGKIENELAEIAENEREDYRRELGLDSDGLGDFIKKCYQMLDLVTFYTANENEARAWSLNRGSRAIDAAAKIHTDMARGFIKAEVINCRELISTGSMHLAKEEGKVRIEGKDYLVKEGDVLLIRFSVREAS